MVKKYTGVSIATTLEVENHDGGNATIKKYSLLTDIPGDIITLEQYQAYTQEQINQRVEKLLKEIEKLGVCQNNIIENSPLDKDGISCANGLTSLILSSVEDFSIDLKTILNTNNALTINFGDNTYYEGNGDRIKLHNYPAGTYRVHINAKTLSLECLNIKPLQEVLLNHLSVYNMLQFKDCTKLTTISANSGTVVSTQNSFKECFMNCTSLVNISENIFAGNTGIKSFESCFQNCTSLATIPSALFANNPMAESFAGCFQNCTNICSGNSNPDNYILDGLFANNTEVTDFSYCFAECPYVDFKEDLFENNPEVLSFKGCFRGCTGIYEVHENIFSNNPEVTDFSYCFLQASVYNIPAGLFANNTKAENFEYCFCTTGITEIPAGLFYSTASSAINFEACFNSCRNLSKLPDEGVFSLNTRAENFKACFQYTAISTIPKNTFYSGKDFSHCFYLCENLTTIEKGVFSVAQTAETFSSCFAMCYNLKVLPENLFDGSPYATDFSGCFSNCKLLTLPSNQQKSNDLFLYNPRITTFESCFAYCISLREIPMGLFYSTQTTEEGVVESFNHCFYGCEDLRGDAPDLWQSHEGATGFACFGNTKLNVSDETPEEWTHY